MQAPFPYLEELKDLNIKQLGEARGDSPFTGKDFRFVDDDARVMVYSNTRDINACLSCGQSLPSFEEAGPRRKLFFHPKDVVAGIVTCGGLCPGLNDVIRAIVLELQWDYGVKKVYGFRYGYQGLSSNRSEEPWELTPEHVDDIQHHGGTILGTSRGPQDLDDMLDTLRTFKVNMLFVVGGDGTFAGAHRLAQRAQERGITLAVVGVPKTIDNDIYCSETTFGFSTAVEEARGAIAAAHNEARAAWNGVGLVKLMGRDSGFISMYATLANSDVNFCLIPEVPFLLDGETGLLARLEKRLERRRHAVIVVSEGAGQDLIRNEKVVHDASGNVIHDNIGLFLKDRIKGHFQQKKIPMNLKYIDPSYIIRSCAANAHDSSYCLLLAQNAVHAAMAGKTDMFVGYWNHDLTHVPFHMAVDRRKRIDPCGELWQTVLTMTD